MTGKINQNEYKLCQTKPIFRKPKINLSHYKIKDYMNNLRLLKMQKQSQTNPIQSQFGPKQSQNKPNLSRRSMAKADQTQFYCMSRWINTTPDSTGIIPEVVQNLFLTDKYK